ncbi:RHS repeat-associated core domain-containing protein [Actinoplanes sp. CA-015351]|uniref:RHS repeat-associated core domain-containing protein n=1 Tax=Actinoplanes sp. CA-015351 TaxID=3239897 RepID=UPI003D994A23
MRVFGVPIYRRVAGSGLVRNSLFRRRTAVVAAGVTGVLLAGLVQPPAASADPKPYAPQVAQKVAKVDVKAAKIDPAVRVADPAPASKQPAPLWPKAAGEILEVPAVSGTVPVHIEATAKQSPARVRAEVLDRKVTERAGVHGVLMRFGRADGVAAAATTKVTLNYTSFATAYGADWSSRLRLVALPSCALSTPAKRECAGTPLVSENDVAAKTLSAQVAVSGVSTLVAATAAASGEAGSYAASPLNSSSNWSAGGNTGTFTWSYPMRVPPSLGGPAPGIGLAYSSQSVDGRHAASNNQPSWAGEGFEASTGGFIERRYIPCSDDMGETANNKEKTGDLCWETDNATMSFSGHSGELIYNATEKRWHVRGDDGTRIERKTGASNGDNDGEHWVVTTTAGIQYWFGLNRLPGWATGKPVTQSTLTVPVFGNDPTDVCHAESFADSDCVQAWRWNLDYVVDLSGNSMSYWYDKDTNRYARNLKDDDAASYDRDGWLERIDYGTRRISGVDSVHGTVAPMRVDFTSDDRCLAECGTHNATRWPDVPWDQACTGETCADKYSPTFWSTKRLATVTTQVRSGSAYRDVDRWTLTHTFPDPGDGTRAGLWLSKIAHTGLVGGSASVPDIEFTAVQMANRVDATGDFAAAMNWMRISRIRTDTGGSISVVYSDADCEAGDTMPNPATNTTRCYPVRWIPEGYSQPVTDWFNKYVVTTIYENDNTGGVPPNGSERIVYRYDYQDGAAWHYNDDDGLIKKKFKTWSDYRGYGRVGVTTGDPGSQTYTESTYFRGMHGDRLNADGGTKSVTVGGVADQDWFAGQTRESTVRNGPGGAVVSRSVSTPWASAPTASRTINGDTVTARFTGIGASANHVTLDGGRGERITRTTTTFDAYGMPSQVDDLGEDGVAGDEKCVKYDYAPRNTTATWILNKVHREQSFAVSCAATTGTLTEDQVIGESRVSYDGLAYKATPAKGLPTQVQTMATWNSGTPTFVVTGKTGYDVHGRATSTTDARGYLTKTAFTPATDGPVTSALFTNPLTHETSNTIEPAWGATTAIVDPNGKRTDTEYDPLGRVTAVWAPGRTKGTHSATVKYGYDINVAAPSVVATSTLNATGGYVTSYTLYDGLARERQTQTPSPTGGRIITEQFYDTAGRSRLQFGAYHADGAAGGTLSAPLDRAFVQKQTRVEYDGAGRPTANVFQPNGVERWRTTTAYGGDRIDVTPPAGGTATSSVIDSRGRTVQLRQYHGATPTGGFDTTTYRFDARGYQTAVVDALGNDWTYKYDVRGRQTEVEDPDRGKNTYTYDNAGNVETSTDSRGAKTAYLYDALGRKRAAYDNEVGGFLRAQWIYDTVAVGQLSQSTRFVGSAAYQVKVLNYNDGYQAGDTQIIIPASETGLAGTYNYNTTYNVDGSVKSISVPGTNTNLQPETLTYGYDGFGLSTTVNSLYGSTNSTYVVGTDYNALAELDQIKLHTGTGEGGRVYTKYTREPSTGRVTGIRTDRDQVAPYILTDTTYRYDDAGNVIQISDAAPAGADTQCFTYDYLVRLTQAWTPAGGDCAAAPSTAALGGPAPYWHSWKFNAIGNRTEETVRTASSTSTTSYQYPASGATAVRPHAVTGTTGARTGGYTYDSAGNTLTRPTAAAGAQTLVWDAEGRLNTATDNTGATTYIYDADGNRLVQRDPTGRTLYLPGQDIRYTTSIASTAATRYYTHAGGTIGTRTSAGLTWTTADHQGTANIAISATNQQATVRRQTPYGSPRGATAGAWPNNRGFVGGVVDNTGLTHLGAREYDPVLGRFVSVDPLQNLADPQHWNGYSYGNNNPITLSDPDGLEPRPWHDPNYSPETNCGGSSYYSQECNPAGPKDYSVDHIAPSLYVSQDDNDDRRISRPEMAAHKLDLDERAHQQKQSYCVLHAAECVAANRAAGMEFLKSLNPLQDAQDCSGGDKMACGMLLAGAATGGLGFLAKSLKGYVKAQKALDAAADAAGCAGGKKSFDGETLVLMADGSTKKISELRVGDEVRATDPETGEDGARRIEAVWVHDDNLYTLTAGGADVVTTEDHPFWNETDREWEDAQELDRGDLVRTPTGTVAVGGFDLQRSRYAKAYNLTVAGLHTYYVLVGLHPVLVHNDKCPEVPFGPQMNYKPNKKHDKGVLGKEIGPHPTRGAEMLNQSFLLNSSSGRRAAYDKVNKEIIIFAPDNREATYHGFVVTWDLLDQKVRSVFVSQGIFNDKGKLRPGWK